MWADAGALMGGEVTVVHRTEGPEDRWAAVTVLGFWHASDARDVAGRATEPRRAVSVQIAEADLPDPSGPCIAVPGDKVVRGAVEYDGDLTGLLRALEGREWATVREVRDLRLGAAASGLGGLCKWASCIALEAS